MIFKQRFQICFPPLPTHCCLATSKCAFKIDAFTRIACRIEAMKYIFNMVGKEWGRIFDRAVCAHHSHTESDSWGLRKSCAGMEPRFCCKSKLYLSIQIQRCCFKELNSLIAPKKISWDSLAQLLL